MGKVLVVGEVVYCVVGRRIHLPGLVAAALGRARSLVLGGAGLLGGVGGPTVVTPRPRPSSCRNRVPATTTARTNANTAEAVQQL